MIIKVIAQIEDNCSEKIYEIPEDSQNINAYDEYFDEVIKKWKEDCKGQYNFQKMFDMFEQIMDNYDISYYSYEDMVDQIIKAKA